MESPKLDKFIIRYPAAGEHQVEKARYEGSAGLQASAVGGNQMPA